MTWRCKCGKGMSFSINKCPNCKRGKETGESMIRLRGDWICIKCGKNNFARRTVCFNTSCSSRNDEGNKSAGPPSLKQETLAAVCRTDKRKQDFSIPHDDGKGKAKKIKIEQSVTAESDDDEELMEQV